MESARRLGRNWPSLVFRLIGAGLLLATGAIHLDLFLTGYRTIPTIGWLFLLQLIAAFGLGVIVLATGSRLASAVGALFSLSTLAGYLLSLRIGLFGFREVRTNVGIVAGIIEVVAFAALAPLAVGFGAVVSVTPATGPRERLPAGFPGDRWTVGGLTIVAGALLAISVAATGPASTGSHGALLKITKIHNVKVLTNARGYTLYWFVPDTPTKSACYGTCPEYWRPVIGRPTAGPGVIGTLGTIERGGGATQATYSGHPLYTYVGDSAPGQANGNDINLNGGLWHVMAATG
jgi:predicted lipoprotein with Yx(FWY)xxD motif